MKKRNIFVIGLGRFGLSLIDELSSYSDEIVGIDSDEFHTQPSFLNRTGSTR